MFKEELVIIRHARSKHNIRESEDMDDAITEHGKAQARNVGRYLYEEIDLTGFKFFTSPFLRCLQTASIIQNWTRPFGQFQVMHELREYLNHTGRECFVRSRKNEFTELDWSLYADEGTTYYDEFNEVFLHRIHDCFHKLPERSVVVTHGLPAFVLLHVARGNVDSVPIWDHSIDNCSITWIKRGRVVWHGRNLYHELEYDSKFYRRDYHDGVTRHTESK